MRECTRQGGARATLPETGMDGSLLFKDVAAGQWTLEVNVLTDGPHHLRFGLGGQEALAHNTASFASVTSTTPDGKYCPGDTVNVRVGFTEPVGLDTFGIRDGTDYPELDGAESVTTTFR